MKIKDILEAKNYTKKGGNGEHVSWEITLNDGKTKKVKADSKKNAKDQLSSEQLIVGVKSITKITEGAGEAFRDLDLVGSNVEWSAHEKPRSDASRFTDAIMAFDFDEKYSSEQLLKLPLDKLKQILGQVKPGHPYLKEGEKHGNSKEYDQCWDGYKKVPGKKSGEKGSCVKEADYDIPDFKDRQAYYGVMKMYNDRIAQAKRSSGMKKSHHLQMAQQHRDQANDILYKHGLAESAELTEHHLAKGTKVTVKNAKKYNALSPNEVTGIIVGPTSSSPDYKYIVKVGTGSMNVDPSDIVEKHNSDKQLKLGESESYSVYDKSKMKIIQAGLSRIRAMKLASSKPNYEYGSGGWVQDLINDAKQQVSEGPRKAIGKRVTVVSGDYKGKTGQIRQIKRGEYGNPGAVKLDLDFEDGSQGVVYKQQARLVKEKIEEAEYQGKKVELNKPKRGGDKKFYVYTKNDKGNVVKVSFGSPDMEIKRDDPERKKAYRARHNCDNPGPKWKANYWSCRSWSDSGKWV
jgi:hypothetical protein